MDKVESTIFVLPGVIVRLVGCLVVQQEALKNCWGSGRGVIMILSFF